MTDYKKYINALRKCAKEHEDDRTSFGHIIVSDLCRDTANLLEELEQEPTTKENLVVEDCISRAELLKAVDTWDRFGCDAGSSKLVPIKDCYVPYIHYDDVVKAIKGMPSVQPKITGHEDCINRQAVNDLIDELARAISDERCCISRGRSTAAIMQDILDLPPVTPKTDVLDKIRAEIIENSIEDYKYHGCGTDELIIETSEVLRILDKYKAESEDKE